MSNNIFTNFSIGFLLNIYYIYFLIFFKKDTLISINNVFSFVNISYCVFQDIYAGTEIINANLINVMNIENSIFRNINFNLNKLVKAGNCLRLSNVLKRNIEYLTLIDTFSDHTTPGLIIIDNDKILANLNKIYNLKNEFFTTVLYKSLYCYINLKKGFYKRLQIYSKYSFLRSIRKRRRCNYDRFLFVFFC